MKAQKNQQINFDTLIQLLSVQGYAICDDFLAANIIDALRDETFNHFTNHDMHAAKTGLVNKLQQPTVRGDHIFWLDEESNNIHIQAYFAKMQALKEVLNQYLFMNLQSLEAHLALYPIGGIYQKHLDQFSHGSNAHADTKARQLSSILYLNNNWQAQDGGELRLHFNEFEHLDIMPTAGKLVLFLSAKFWHEVRPAKRERASITGWFRTRNQMMF